MFQDTRKRRGGSDDDAVDEAGKRPRTPAKSDEEEYEYSSYSYSYPYCYSNSDDFFSMSEIPIKEETIEEVMKLLEKELGSSIKETCGPSVSDESSSVMASVDMSGYSSISQLMQQTEFFPSQSVFCYPSLAQTAKTTQTCCYWPPEELSYCECESCLNLNSKIDFLTEEVEKKKLQQGEEEQVSASDETNGCDRGEESDDDWLEALLSWDECPIDLVD